MNRSTLFNEALRLERAVEGALAECGCVLQLKHNGGVRRLIMPIEKATYDPQTGLIAVALNPTILPRGFTESSLVDDGFRERIAIRFQGPVKIVRYKGRVVVMAVGPRGQDRDGRRPNNLGPQPQSGGPPHYRVTLN